MLSPTTAARGTTRRWLGLAAVPLLAAVGLAGSNASAYAAPHQVRYTVTSATPVYANIYYRDTDPPTYAGYSHNPYEFSPKAEADIGPGRPWVLDVTLEDPNQWAMVTATSGDSNVTTGFHCDLAVDGVVVVSEDGDKGALCSLRNW